MERGSLGIAAALCVSFIRRDTGVSESAFFYDLSEKKLFAAPREALFIRARVVEPLNR